MEIQQAIEWQEAIKRVYKNAPKEIANACEMAIVALEKQRGLKPATNQYYYFCPNCGTRRSIKQKHNYRHDCGYKFDWSKNDH